MARRGTSCSSIVSLVWQRTPLDPSERIQPGIPTGCRKMQIEEAGRGRCSFVRRALDIKKNSGGGSGFREGQAAAQRREVQPGALDVIDAPNKLSTNFWDRIAPSRQSPVFGMRLHSFWLLVVCFSQAYLITLDVCLFAF